MHRRVVHGIALVLMVLTPVSVHAQGYAYADQWGSAGTGAGQFSHPVDIGADGNGRVHVIDWAGRGQTFTSNGAIIGSWGDGAMVHPNGLWAGAGSVFVADVGDGMIHRFDLQGEPIDAWTLSRFNVAAGSSGPYPLDVAVAPEGEVYATFGSFSGGGIVSFSHDGTSRSDWDVSHFDTRSLAGVSSLAVSGDGVLYAADSERHRILVLSRNGSYVTEWGTQGSGPGQFQGPCGLAIDREGSVFVADSGNDRVQKLTGSGTFLTSFGSHGTGDGQFVRPVAVAVSSHNEVFVVDQRNHRVQRFEAAGTTPVVPGSWGTIKRRYETVAR